MNSDEFFREATLRICGNLQIEKGLQECVSYLSEFMPADHIHLEKYDDAFTMLHLIAAATSEKADILDQAVHLPEEIVKEEEKFYQKSDDGSPSPVLVYNQPADEFIFKAMIESVGTSDFSVMILPLVNQDQIAGALVLRADGTDRFTEQHAKLFGSLRDPFFIAMSNYLKHRNELRLFDRDFFFEVTRRICGNLEVEKGLYESIKYISQFMPADRMYLQRYQQDLNSMNLIARADKDSYEKMDAYIPFNQEAKDKLIALADVWRSGGLPPILIINDPENEPVTRCMLNGLNEPMSSALSLPLTVKDKVIGTLVLLAEGENRFDEEHAKLFSTLKLPFFVALSNTLKHREVLTLQELLADDNRYLQGELRRISGDEIIGSDFGLRQVMQSVGQVAKMDSPVLLLGETGVGKDVIANAIHYSSNRKDGPFVSVNCGAIPDTLLDSELFGHEKGAFTGALAQKRGRFERADKGTIFLDEIGELPLQAQVRLLKVLQSKEIERVGGVKTIALDIRIIAATNRNLTEMVKEGKFREDLWFRLNVFPIIIPPLRQRKSDIPALVQYFITQKVKELKLPSIPKVSPDSIDLLLEYDWPGNVRELENIIERTLILNPSGPLAFDQLNVAVGDSGRSVDGAADNPDNLDQMTSRHIQKVLSKTEGKIHGPDGAAKLLGLNANTLRNRMDKLGIMYKKPRSK